MDTLELWHRYRQHLCIIDELNIALDISRMQFSQDWLKKMEPHIGKAFEAMDALEAGAIANPDEKRKAGHYWLRAPELAPPDEAAAIRHVLGQLKAFTAAVHTGKMRPPNAERFTRLLIIGIGGSALGPQLAADALAGPQDFLEPYFFDNTDPDGFDRVLSHLGSALKETLVIVISKSGSTKETRNGMLEAQAAFAGAGLCFSKHAVAITGHDSQLHHAAADWLMRFPMWDWVGGRTSQTSVVGLLPAALQGIDIDQLLDGASCMDRATRVKDVPKNPAALLALMWHHGSDGTGKKSLVVLPYKDRLLLMSRYLQQLVMESLGKALDLDGIETNQGLTVYGNKGSSDQHAYVQQLRDGIANFFVLFIEVLKDRNGTSIEVETRITSGDYLLGFLLGTRSALYDRGRESMILTLPDVNPRSLGALIALFERAVGLYASLIHVNAYHQPGVEAGKQAAEKVLALQQKVLDALTAQPMTAEALAERAYALEQTETVFKLLQHLAANGRVHCKSAPSYLETQFYRL